MYLQIPIVDLTNAEFSSPSQANSFYPKNDARTHIHLGTPTQAEGRTAKPGNVFITYISIKVEDRVIGKLVKCPNGYFDANSAPRDTPQRFLNVLDNLDLLSGGCPPE